VIEVLNSEIDPASSTGVRVGVGVHDALTARLAERAGFDLLWLGSLEVCSRFGIPDRNLLTPTEMAAVVREVRAVTELPVYVDADNGYGSDFCAMRAVRDFEAAGAFAVCIEDNAFPKRNSLVVGESRELVPADEFAVRLNKMTESRKELRIIARTEALIAGLGTDEAVRRLHMYAQAGVDGLFVQINSACRDQLFPVLEQIRGLLPIVLAPTALPEVSLEEFGGQGVSTVLFANVVVRRLLTALSGTLGDLRRSCRLADVEDVIASVSEVLQLAGPVGE
jgi:2-methylisocitrate lyase-like PEP mutase family enzyme